MCFGLYYVKMEIMQFKSCIIKGVEKNDNSNQNRIIL